MNATSKLVPASSASAVAESFSSVRAMARSKEIDDVRRQEAYIASPLMLYIKPGFNVRRTELERSRLHIDAIKVSLREFIAKAVPGNPENRVAPNLKPVIGEIGVFLNEEGKLQVWDGYHRTTALLELIAEGYEIGHVSIDARPHDDKDVNVAMLRSGMAMNHTPLERAIGYARLADEFGMRAVDIASEMGVTAQRVDQLLLLGRAPAEIHDLVANGQVSADSAIEVIRKHREKALSVLIEMRKTKGEGRIGKGLTRMAMPKKAQDGVFTAIRSNSHELEQQLAKHRKTEGDGWKKEMISIELPAEVVAELLERQKAAQGA